MCQERNQDRNDKHRHDVAPGTRDIGVVEDRVREQDDNGGGAGGRGGDVSVTLVPVTTPPSDEDTNRRRTIEPGTSRIELTGNHKIPTTIQLGKTNWFGFEHRNTGTATWRGYIGVKLWTPAGTSTGTKGTPRTPRAWRRERPSTYGAAR